MRADVRHRGAFHATTAEDDASRALGLDPGAAGEGRESTVRGPLLTALKHATASLHRELEEQSRLSHRPLTRADYRAHLVAMAGFHAPLEDRLFAAHDWHQLGLPDAGARIRRPLLKSDLLDLGLVMEELPQCEHLPKVQRLGSALGCLYVLEGSTLGGQMLARGLASLDGRPLPDRFLQGAGALTGSRWRDLCAFAERLGAQEPSMVPSVLEGAQETFLRMTHWLASRPLE